MVNLIEVARRIVNDTGPLLSAMDAGDLHHLRKEMLVEIALADARGSADVLVTLEDAVNVLELAIVRFERLSIAASEKVVPRTVALCMEAGRHSA